MLSPTAATLHVAATSPPSQCQSPKASFLLHTHMPRQDVSFVCKFSNISGYDSSSTAHIASQTIDFEEAELRILLYMSGMLMKI